MIVILAGGGWKSSGSECRDNRSTVVCFSVSDGARHMVAGRRGAGGVAVDVRKRLWQTTDKFVQSRRNGPKVE